MNIMKPMPEYPHFWGKEHTIPASVTTDVSLAPIGAWVAHWFSQRLSSEGSWVWLQYPCCV